MAADKPYKIMSTLIGDKTYIDVDDLIFWLSSVTDGECSDGALNIVNEIIKAMIKIKK